MGPVETTGSREGPSLDAYATIRCEVRLQNEIDTSMPSVRRRIPGEAEQRRRDAGHGHEAGVLAHIADALGDAFVAIPTEDRPEAQRLTLDAIEARREVIAQAWLPEDPMGRRRGRPDLLVATDDGYLPIEIKLHLLTTEGGGSLESSPLSAPHPAAASTIESRRLRKGAVWVDDAIQLAHYYRMLESMGLAGQVDGLLGGVIDGSGTLWWIDLDQVGGRSGRTPLAEYDSRFSARLALADQAMRRNHDPSIPRSADPWFHKECETCDFSEVCAAELEEADDVSLVRWSSTETLVRLHRAGVHTRRQLAELDLELVDLGERLDQMSLSLPAVVELAAAAEPGAPIDEVVGRRMGVRRHLTQAAIGTAGDLTGRDETTLALAGRIRDLGRLVRRARAHLGGGALLQVPAAELDAARADVEVDVDMESYESATYLWGAQVTVRTPIDGIIEGYRSFVTFETLDEEAEASIFAAFWSWLDELRTAVRAQGRSFRAYCFWRAAEESQMRRAAAIGGEGVPTGRTLERFFRSTEWVDLHELVREQLLTDGRLGLKVLATRAGFSWRDEDPSGEASIGWYEEAIGADPATSSAARARLLAYNEDDVLATRALRDWLDGPARQLPHVDEVLGQGR
jgi:predicted RecB family nuclease